MSSSSIIRRTFIRLSLLLVFMCVLVHHDSTFVDAKRKKKNKGGPMGGGMGGMGGGMGGSPFA